MAKTVEFFWEIGEVARRSRWEIRRGENSRFNRIVTDTRLLKPSSSDSILFVALSGTKTDGHLFISEAILKGARGIVVQKGWSGEVPGHITVVTVPNPRVALGDLARYKVEHYRGKILAITGSSGKTTTKYLLARMLGQGFMAPGNFNNDIGVPLSVFSAPLSEPYWIFELGMNARGEIAYLASILKPHVALLLPAGYAHIGFLGSKRAILQAKAELLTAHPPELAILASSRYIPFLSPSTPWVIVYPSLSCRRNYTPPPRSEFFVNSRRIHFPTSTEVEVGSQHKLFRISVVHLVGASLALPVALACAGSVTLTGGVAETIIELEEHEGRMRIYSLGDRFIVDDSYNASLESFLAFLDTLEEIHRETEKELFLLLGEMKELGKFSLRLHLLLARRLKTMEIRWLGALGEDLHKALRKEEVSFTPFTDPDEAVRSALKVLASGGVLGLKGAHGTGIFTAFHHVLPHFYPAL